MPSPSMDRLFGANSSLAIKAPVRVGTTVAITLSGEQTIDGVAVIVGDRVLVKNQGNTVYNGIYIADTSAWNRAPDFDGMRDVAKGTAVYVTDGDTMSDTSWIVTSANTIRVGTSDISWEQRIGPSVRFTNDFARYDSDPVLVDNSLTGTIPGGVAWVNGVAARWPEFSVTLAPNRLRRYYINALGVVSYDEVAVSEYTTIARRNPGLVFIYHVASDASEISAILPMSNTFPTTVRDSHISGNIDRFVEIFYLYDVTTAWSAALPVTYGQLLLTTTGKVYQVREPGTTGGSAPTSTAAGNITDGTAILFYYCQDTYLGMFRYGANNGVEYYFCNLGLQEVMHQTLRSGSPLGPGAGTTLSSLILKYIQGCFKHLCMDFFSAGTYVKGMKLITDGWIWKCTTAGAVAATNAAFTAAAPHSLGQNVTSGAAVFTAIYQSYGSQKWFWLNVDSTYLVYRYPDSHDSYCASFFSLVAEYIRATGDVAWLSTASPQPSVATYKAVLDELIYQNLDIQLANFLSKTFQGNIHPLDGSAFTTQYLEDNCETVKGYRDAAYVYDLLGDTARRDAALSNVTYVSDGVYNLYNVDHDLFGWYYGDNVATWAGETDLQFYPYIQAQLFPEKCELAVIREDMHYLIRQNVFGLYSNWITDRGKDSFPNNFIGLLAAKNWHDPVLAYSFIDQSERYHMTDGTMIISEYGCYLRIKDLLVAPNEILKVSDTDLIIEDRYGTSRNLMRSGRTVKAMADANKTLTPEEARAQVIEATGALTALRDIILPLTVGKHWTVFSNTTGAFGVRYKGATGTGITVADTRRAIVYADGTNVVRATPDT